MIRAAHISDASESNTDGGNVCWRMSKYTPCNSERLNLRFVRLVTAQSHSQELGKKKHGEKHAHLSSDAFNSNTASLKLEPRRARARHRMLVVLPVPGGPYIGERARCVRAHKG